MKKSQVDATTVKNLEENEARGRRDMAGKAERVTVERCGRQLRYKFDRGENVLDYFDARKARIIDPQSKRSSAKTKFPYPVKRSAKRAAVVRENRGKGSPTRLRQGYGAPSIEHVAIGTRAGRRQRS